jgi:4-hydroxy-3-polyprenylbenzoate decarboxylase
VDPAGPFVQRRPFGEATGYIPHARAVPVLTVERVYHRNDPINLGAPCAKPPRDFSYMRSVLKSAMIRDALVKAELDAACGRPSPRREGWSSW